MRLNEYAATRALLALGAVIIPIVSVIPPVVAWIRGSPLRWETDTARSGELPGSLVRAQDGAALHWDGVIRYDVPNPSGIDHVLALLPTAIGGALVGLALLVLFRVVGAAQSGTPFIPTSIIGLRLLAAICVTGALIVPFLTMVADTRFVGRVTTGSVPTSYAVSFAWLVGGLVILALASVFQHGSRLEAEVEGLV